MTKDEFAAELECIPDGLYIEKHGQVLIASSESLTIIKRPAAQGQWSVFVTLEGDGVGDDLSTALTMALDYITELVKTRRSIIE